MARILVLTARLPYPPREGHQLRSWHVLRALAAVHEVTLLSCLRDDDLPHECAPLRDAVAQLELFPIAAQRSRTALIAAVLNGMFGPQPQFLILALGIINTPYVARIMRAAMVAVLQIGRCFPSRADDWNE